jgi:hypothetical protein
MPLRLIPRPRSPVLRRTAVLVLLTFGPVACFWKTVPITKIESGEQKVEGVKLRLHRQGAPESERQELVVSRLEFPLVWGTDPSAPEPRPETSVDLRTMDEIEAFSAGRGVVGIVFGTVLGAAALAALVVLIVALTKKSCPYVYVVGPGGPALVGEAYSGATSRALQRDDLMPLPAIGPGRARLLLTNEALEQQLTDRLELLGVEHAPGVRAVATPDARVLLVAGEAAPLRASDLEGGDGTALLAEQDRRAWETDMEGAVAGRDPPLRSGVEATFHAPPTRPVLEVTLANTPFLDVVTGHFFAARGEGSEAIRARESAPSWADEVWRWRQRPVRGAVARRSLGAGLGDPDHRRGGHADGGGAAALDRRRRPPRQAGRWAGVLAHRPAGAVGPE